MKKEWELYFCKAKERKKDRKKERKTERKKERNEEERKWVWIIISGWNR